MSLTHQPLETMLLPGPAAPVADLETDAQDALGNSFLAIGLGATAASEGGSWLDTVGDLAGWALHGRRRRKTSPSANS